MKQLRQLVFGRQSGQDTPQSSLYAEFSVRQCKPITDEVDRIPTGYYGFTDEELDFIINYDIKYRLGQDGAEGAAEE
jgi:hypothetical protein